MKSKKILILFVLIIMLIILGIVGYNYWYNSDHYVSTEDARITGDFIRVTPQVSGRLLDFNIHEGDRVIKDQIIGHIIGTGIALLKAPMTGLIIKKQEAVGEFITAGSTVAVMVNPDCLYITANIEETKIEKVKIGQQVDINLDQFNNKKFSGKVIFIGQAANSVFSLLPSSSAGTFTKVMQKVPVKIKLEDTGVKLLLGSNVVIKIHVR